HHAGSFYPADAQEIEHYINTFDDIKTEHLDLHPRALIVPHAGYVYSGFTANLAYTQLEPSRRRIIVIGPSHRVAYEGMSISIYDEYETPFGNLTVDKAYAQALKETFAIDFADAMHREHSTEVQMPFIKHYLPEAKVIEIVYGRQDPAELSKVIEHLLQDENNLVVISTDLSHFYKEEDANMLDTLCLKAIAEEDIEMLHRGCEACGKIGVEAMVLASKRMGLTSKLLDYRTSSWASKDTSSVVGYTSAIFY
ncbi:MAG: AmmeMemoRadiSam system protein B, partial [Sulfurimonadaceae bacterium]|nr:AmmeMemoRadiSam system protein B [Sulfurimonadaceae bacterium]